MGHIFEIEISTGAVAWYGAIVATASFMISLLNHLRDRSRIKVKVYYGSWSYGGFELPAVRIIKRPLPESSDQIVIIDAANLGRRVVTLDGAGFSLTNKKNISIMHSELIQFPCELKEGKAARAETAIAGLYRDEKEMGGHITHAWYRSSTGKTFRKRYRLPAYGGKECISATTGTKRSRSSKSRRD